MRISEGLRNGADSLLNSLFRGKNGHPPDDLGIEAIHDWLKTGEKPPPEVGEVCENALMLNHPPDSPGDQST